MKMEPILSSETSAIRTQTPGNYPDRNKLHMEACLQMGGPKKCSIVPPEKLYQPLLFFRSNKKLLCRTCVLEHNISEQCTHSADVERAVTGTWVIDEVVLTVEKCYKINEIYEVYEYEVTRYDPITSEGGLLVDYTNTFLKLKEEASGYPGWVKNPEDEELYIQSFWRVKESD